MGRQLEEFNFNLIQFLQTVEITFLLPITNAYRLPNSIHITLIKTKLKFKLNTHTTVPCADFNCTL